MIYFSELRGKKIFTEDHVEVGQLDDLIFLVSDTPKITKLLIKDKAAMSHNIPVSNLLKINKEIIINKNYSDFPLEENELFVLRNLLDKQIIDLKNNKIVRVNDIAIQDKQDKGSYYISGIDIGFLGIIRWLNLERLVTNLCAFFGLKLSPRMLSWADIQPLELTRGQVKLRKEEKKLENLRPEDLADYLEKTNILNIKKILKILDQKYAADVIESLNINFQTSLFKQFELPKAAKILELMDPDDAVDILLTFPPKKRKELLNLIEDSKKPKIIHLLQHSEFPIGEVMRTDFLTVSSSDTVREVINKIKKETADYYYFNIVYVVNNGQLIGIFNLHSLLLQDLDIPVYKFMIQDVIVVHITTPKEIAIKRILKYGLYSLPVINDKKNILGIVTLGDLLDL